MDEVDLPTVDDRLPPPSGSWVDPDDTVLVVAIAKGNLWEGKNRNRPCRSCELLSFFSR